MGFSRVPEQSGAQSSGSPLGLLLSTACSLAQPDRAGEVHLHTQCLVAMDLSLLGRLRCRVGEVWVLHALCAAWSTARYSLVRWRCVLTLSKYVSHVHFCTSPLVPGEKCSQPSIQTLPALPQSACYHAALLNSNQQEARPKV